MKLQELKQNDIHKEVLDYDTFGVSEEIGDLIDFLHEDEMMSTGFVTKKRIVSNLDSWGRIINQWICYPDLFVDLITPVHSEFTLYPFQRMMMREMARKTQSYFVFSRGTSKSFCGFLERYIHADLIPRHRTGIIAGTKKQAASIAKEKIIDDLWNKFPFLGQEMQKRHVAGKYLDAYNAGMDYAKFSFKNGSWVDVASDRGLRRESILLEEIIEQDPTFVNEIAIPWTNKPRTTSRGTMNPNEPHSQKIFVTTAGYQGTYAYNKLIQTLVMSVFQPARYSVLTGDYKLPLYHDLIRKSEIEDKLNDPTFSKESFEREYMSIWSDAPTGAAFKANTIALLRKVKLVELKSKIADQSEEFYVVSVDMAKDGDAKTAGMVARVIPKQFFYTYKIVNLFTIENSDYSIVANKLKEYVIRYNAKLLVYDANGVGASLRDWLNKPTVNDDGIPLDGLGIINPPDTSEKSVIVYPSDRTIVYEIKSGGTKGAEIHNFLFSRISNGSITFPITTGEAVDLYGKNDSFMKLSSRKKAEIMLPYKLMDLAETQFKNLDITDTSDNINHTSKIVRRNASIQKDFFSSLEYLVYATNKQLEIPYYQGKFKPKRSLLDAFLFD